MGYGETKYIVFDGIIVGGSPKAHKFQGDFMDDPIWVPISQCKVEPNLNSNEEGRVYLHIADWLCRKNAWNNS